MAGQPKNLDVVKRNGVHYLYLGGSLYDLEKTSGRVKAAALNSPVGDRDVVGSMRGIGAAMHRQSEETEPNSAMTSWHYHEAYRACDGDDWPSWLSEHDTVKFVRTDGDGGVARVKDLDWSAILEHDGCTILKYKLEEPF